MDSNEFEAWMRRFEYFHALRLMPDTWVVVRVDGRGFSKLTEKNFDKPFDIRFRDAITATAQAVFKEMQGVYAYTESDEISVLFKPNWDLFDRELEKVVSVSAGIASAAFSLAIGEAAHFDSRVWLGINRSLVIDYFRWRQSDAARCALNGWCYWTLRQTGKSVNEATETVLKKSVEFKNELLYDHGVNFNALPSWQRGGIGVYWEEYEKAGYDPVRKETVTAKRRRVKIDLDLPMKDEYSRFIRKLLK